MYAALLLVVAGCGAPAPGSGDPGPPAQAPESPSSDPIHDPPPVSGLPTAFPSPPADLAGQLWASPSAPRAGLEVDGDALRAVLRDPSDKIDVEKRHAAVLLGAARAVAALPDLHDALVRERGPGVKAAVAGALGAIGDARSLVPLWDALRDRSLAVRLASIGALGRLDLPACVPPLAALAGHRGDEARAALLALGGMKTPAASEALAALPTRAVADLADLPVVEASGRTVHVDATAGDDAGPGTAEAPFRTLSRGVLELRPGAGDTLLATGGARSVPFREEVDVLPQSSGTAGAPTVLKAWPGRTPPVLDGELAGRPGEPGMGIGLHIGASWVRVEGFTVRHYRESGIDLSGSEGNVLVGCTAERCERHGLFVYYSVGATLVEPTVRDCAAQGISVRSSPGTVIVGGTSMNNGIDGLLLLQDSDDVVVDGLVTSGNARGIAFTTGSNRGRVLRVTVEGNRDAGIAIEADSDATVL